MDSHLGTRMNNRDIWQSNKIQLQREFSFVIVLYDSWFRTPSVNNERPNQDLTLRQLLVCPRSFSLTGFDTLICVGSSFENWSILRKIWQNQEDYRCNDMAMVPHSASFETGGYHVSVCVLTSCRHSSPICRLSPPHFLSSPLLHSPPPFRYAGPPSLTNYRTYNISKNSTPICGPEYLKSNFNCKTQVKLLRELIDAYTFICTWSFGSLRVITFPHLLNNLSQTPIIHYINMAN